MCVCEHISVSVCALCLCAVRGRVCVCVYVCVRARACVTARVCMCVFAFVYHYGSRAAVGHVPQTTCSGQVCHGVRVGSLDSSGIKGRSKAAANRHM